MKFEVADQRGEGGVRFFCAPPDQDENEDKHLFGDSAHWTKREGVGGVLGVACRLDLNLRAQGEHHAHAFPMRLHRMPEKSSVKFS